MQTEERVMTSEGSHSAMVPTHVAAVIGFLEGLGIGHEVVEHDSVMSAAAEARVTHMPLGQVAKTVMLLEDDSTYVLAAIPASARLDLGKLGELLGATRNLRLATEAEIARDFPVFDVGAMPLFGPSVPAIEVIDTALVGLERVMCPAGDHRHSVLVDPGDVVRITAAKVAEICKD